MIYLFLAFEAGLVFIILICLYPFDKKFSLGLAKALLLSLFLSVISLILAGLFFPIRFWVYVGLKSALALLVFLFLRSKAPFLETLSALMEKAKKECASPLPLFAAFIFLCLLLRASGSFPVLWDSYSYHLPVAASFFKNGLLSHYQYYGISIGSYYPHSIELLYALFFSISGIESSSLINFPSILLLFWGIFLFSRDILGINPRLSLLGSLAFLFLPFISRYFYEANVDLYFLDFCLFAAYFLFRWDKGRNNQDLIWLFLSLGLMLGTRYQGLSLSLFLGIFLLGRLLGHKGWQSLNGVTLAALSVSLLAGGFFYWRNFHLTGNPVFPLRTSLPGFFAFKGHYEYSVLATQTAILFNLGSSAGRILPVLVQELSFGLTVFPFLWLSRAFNYLKKNASPSQHPKVKPLLLISSLLFLIFLTTPYSAIDTGGGFNFSLRLGLPFLAFLYLASLASAKCSDNRIIAAGLVLPLLGLVRQSLFSEFKALFLAGLLTLTLAVLVKIWKSFAALPAFAVVVLAVIVLLRPVEKKWPNYFSPKQSENLNIAYAGSNRHFQLYDKDLKYNIFYLNVDRNQDLKWDREILPSYHKQKGSFFIWLRNLQQERIDYFVLLGKDSNFIESRWVRDHPEIFSKQAENTFRVNLEEVRKYLSGE